MGALIFNEENHTYTLDGKPLMSVTKILRPAGADYSKIPPHVLENARVRGVASHKACELYDLGILDNDSVDDIVRPYLNGWIKFVSEHDYEHIASEIPLYSEKYMYAGTPDKLCLLDGVKTIIDLKCTAKMSPVTALQTSAYAEPTSSTRRLCVRLKNDGTYEKREYTDKNDFYIFLSLLNIAKWSAKNGS